MSYSVENDPLQWSHFAEEARAIADEMSDPGAKKTLIGIAEAYEAMRKRAEQRCLAARAAKQS